MLLTLASISHRSASKSSPTEALVLEYIHRATRLSPVDAVVFTAESALLQSAARQPSRPAALLLLFDARGESLTSEAFAAYLGQLRDRGAQRVLFGIGPADGWSTAARAQATRIVSLGAMTLPHELARVVAAEQIYRALTILAGHPYHSGH